LQLHLGRKAEALEGLRYVSTLPASDALAFEVHWAIGLLCLQAKDPVAARCAWQACCVSFYFRVLKNPLRTVTQWMEGLKKGK
jgi:hypothetical protein